MQNEPSWESELTLRDAIGALEAIEDQIYVFKMSGDVVYLNRSARNALPGDRAKTLENIFAVREDFMLYDLDGEPVPFDQRPLNKIAAGEPVRPMDVMSVHRVSGKTLYRRLAASPVDGESGLAVLQVKDISPQIESMRALERARNRFEALFKSGPMATALTTIDDGRFLDVNKMFLSMFGYTRDEVIGRTVSELGLWMDQQRRAAIVRELEMHGRVLNREVECHITSGDSIQILTSWSMVEYGEDDRAILTAIIDITERKAVEEELERALQDIVDDASGFAKSIIDRLPKTPSIEAKPSSPNSEFRDMFTPREREVLIRAARGANDEEISNELGIAQVTVRNYLSRIYKKLDVNSRVEAVVWARDRGLH